MSNLMVPLKPDHGEAVVNVLIDILEWLFEKDTVNWVVRHSRPNRHQRRKNMRALPAVLRKYAKPKSVGSHSVTSADERRRLRNKRKRGVK